MFRFILMIELLVSTAAATYAEECAAYLGCTESQSLSCGCATGIQMGACCSQCPICPIPECGICGTGHCWDCSDDEGIDVDSLTAAAQSKKLYELGLARIKIELPEESPTVWLQNQRMTTLGVKRTFVVPIANRDKAYKYEVKVDVVRNGKKYFKKFLIEELRAGMIIKLTVKAPKVPEGAEVSLTIEDADKQDADKQDADKQDADKSDD